MTVTEGWLGIVKNEDKQFCAICVAKAAKFLEYVDGAPYAHISGAVTYDMNDAGQGPSINDVPTEKEGGGIILKGGEVE